MSILAATIGRSVVASSVARPVSAATPTNGPLIVYGSHSTTLSTMVVVGTGTVVVAVVVLVVLVLVVVDVDVVVVGKVVVSGGSVVVVVELEVVLVVFTAAGAVVSDSPLQATITNTDEKKTPTMRRDAKRW